MASLWNINFIREAAKKVFFVARPLREGEGKGSKKIPPPKNVATKLEGGGVGLRGRATKKTLYFLRLPQAGYLTLFYVRFPAGSGK